MWAHLKKATSCEVAFLLFFYPATRPAYLHRGLPCPPNPLAIGFDHLAPNGAVDGAFESIADVVAS